VCVCVCVCVCVFVFVTRAVPWDRASVRMSMCESAVIEGIEVGRVDDARCTLQQNSLGGQRSTSSRVSMNVFCLCGHASMRVRA
jgi:hypothetical protein